MKKTNKLLALSLLIFSSLAIAGCDNNTGANSGNVSQDEVVSNYLSLNNSSLKLIIGDQTRIISYTNLSENVTWSSTNPLIVTADNEGRIEALRNGECAIIASCGDMQASCNVSVSSDIYLPTLVFNANVNDSEQIPVNSNLDLSCYVVFNNRKFYDVEISYELSNPLIGTINDKGILTSSDKINETSNITIKAKWRGFDLPSMSKQISVKIITRKNVYLNGGSLNNIELYTIDQILDESYITEQAFTVEAVHDDVAVNVTNVELVDNDGVASLDYNQSEKSGKITAIKEGSAKLRVTFEDKDSVICTNDFPINVNMPIYNYTEVIPYFSLDDGLYYKNNVLMSLKDLFPSGQKTILKATQNSNDLTVSEGSKVFGAITKTKDGFEEVNLRLFNDKIGMNITVSACDKIIKNIDDIAALYTSRTPDADAKTYFKGFAYVANDIVVSQSNPVSYVAAEAKKWEMHGIIDGGGHKISCKMAHENGSSEEFGLFGGGIGGTIKNLGFENCVTEAAETGFLVHHVSNDLATLENCFFDITIDETKNPNAKMFAIMFSTYGYLNVRKVVIYVPEETHSTKANGAFACHRLKSGSDFYIISPNEIGYDTVRKFRSYASDADKQADTTTGLTQYVIAGLTKVNTIAELQAKRLTFATFPIEYWDIVDYVPVFKGCSYNS